MEMAISLLLLENFERSLIPPCSSLTHFHSIFNTEFYIPLKNIFAVSFSSSLLSFPSPSFLSFLYLLFFPHPFFSPLFFSSCAERSFLSIFLLDYHFLDNADHDFSLIVQFNYVCQMYYHHSMQTGEQSKKQT